MYWRVFFQIYTNHSYTLHKINKLHRFNISRHVFSVFSSCLLFKVLAEEASDLLCRTLVCTGCDELPVAGLRALRLDHLCLPGLFEGIPMGLAHIVQDAAGEDHGGNHVQAAVVPLA